ncbi:MAG: amidohydrolase family protein, partial [Chloroflexi bacterium]|nr:amidohydrolase family protein [Chloroflexota bacterium]
LEAQGAAVNVATFVGHVTLREAVLGEENRPPRPSELAAMKDLLAQGLDEGSWGLSSGLIYRPGSFADTEELTALAEVVGQYGGVYATHIRGERETLLPAVAEAIAIGERAGVPVHISHLKAVGRENWGQAAAALQLMEQARGRGVDVTYDSKPFLGTPVKVWTGMIPAWARTGALEDLRRRFADPQARQRILAETPPQGWETIFVARYAAEPAWCGRSLADLAQEQGLSPLELALEMFVADPDHETIQSDCLSETDVQRTVSHPLGMISSDALLHPQGLPHPRSYTAFAEALQRYVREEQVLSLGEAVRRMTSAPAQRLGLGERGLLLPGWKADVVVFDPQRICSRATYGDPRQPPLGIEAVFVSGRRTVERGAPTGVRAGRVLRRGVD